MILFSNVFFVLGAAGIAAAGHGAGESPDFFDPSFLCMQMIALGLLLLGAQLGGKFCRRMGLSEVTGQLVGGALVGPYALQVAGVIGEDPGLYGGAVYTFRFFIFVFLSVVAFGIGEELYWNRLKNVGWNAVVICLIQAFATWIAISMVFIAFGEMPLIESLLIGSIGVATAPAITFVMMNKLHVEGRLRHMVGSTVVIDDLLEVILFSVLVQIALREPAARGASVVTPVFQEIVQALLIGTAIYLLLRLVVRRHPARIELDETELEEEGNFLQRLVAEHPSPTSQILILVFGLVSLGAGLAYFWHLPFLITAMFAGFLASNFHSHAVFDALKLDHISPVLNLLFFALIGAGISFAEVGLDTVEFVGLYIAARLVGKVGGTWLGCKLMREDRKITVCLPRLMLPQAGVAAVEAVYVSAVLGKPEISVIILPAIVFFEVGGVVIVDRTLRRWKSWVAGEEDVPREAVARGARDESVERLLAYLSAEAVTLELEGTTKDQVVEELLDCASKTSRHHIDRAQALQLLGERERLAPTGVGNGVAIPHCRLLRLGRPVVAFGRHRSGVVFGGIDESPCTLIVLILTDARKPGEHLKLLSAAGHLLSDEKRRRQLSEARTPHEVLEVLRGSQSREG